LLPCIKGTYNQGIQRHPANVALLSLQLASCIHDYAPSSTGRLPRNIIQIILCFTDYQKSDGEVFKWISDRIAIRAELCHEVYLAIENLITTDAPRPDILCTSISRFLLEANNRLEDRSRVLVQWCWESAINIPMLSEYGKKFKKLMYDSGWAMTVTGLTILIPISTRPYHRHQSLRRLPSIPWLNLRFSIATPHSQLQSSQ
jgi:hypothetical protein